jgi:Uma2 family endonuclease
MLPIITKDIIDLPPGTRIQFPATLAEYEHLLEQLGDRAGLRLRFRNDHILLMAPLPEHGNQTDILSDLVKALLRYQNRDWQSFDAITLKKSGIPGVEPDACFYIENRDAILGKPRFDLDTDPPPDLAIETDLTSFTDINDYLPIAVPEVWIYQAGKLHIHRFVADRYVETTSQLFPTIPIAEILPNYVNRTWEVGSSVALREFEQFLRSLEQDTKQ